MSTVMDKFDAITTSMEAAGCTPQSTAAFVGWFIEVWNALQDYTADRRPVAPTGTRAAEFVFGLVRFGMGRGAARLAAAAGFVPVEYFDPAETRRRMVADLEAVTMDEASAARLADEIIASFPRPSANAAWFALECLLASPSANVVRASIADQLDAVCNYAAARGVRGPAAEPAVAVIEWWARATGVPVDELYAARIVPRAVPAYAGDSVAWTAALRDAVCCGAVPADEALAIAFVACVAWDAGYRDRVAAVVTLAHVALEICPADRRPRPPHISDNWFRTVRTTTSP